jgi:hemerythrin-like domain-containing protein
VSTDFIRCECPCSGASLLSGGSTTAFLRSSPGACKFCAPSARAEGSLTEGRADVSGTKLALELSGRRRQMLNSELATEAQEGLRAQLTRDHQELDQLFASLLDALQADARVDVARLWSAIDDGLYRHMALEEEQVLPLLRQHDAREADVLLAEHAEIRAKLAELGMGIDLHEIVVQTVRDFVEQLRRHARREDALAYRWAEQHLTAARQAEVHGALAAARTVRQRLMALGRKAKNSVRLRP